MARSGGASACSAGAGSWTGARGSKAVTRSLRREQERESDGSGRESDVGRRGMGSTPPQAVLFIGGPPILSVAVPSSVQNASTALSREVLEKIKVDFSQNMSQLRPKSEFRSLGKKTTSGRPVGKSFCKPPYHVNLGL
jgi:hypothetical protein